MAFEKENIEKEIEFVLTNFDQAEIKCSTDDQTESVTIKLRDAVEIEREALRDLVKILLGNPTIRKQLMKTTDE